MSCTTPELEPLENLKNLICCDNPDWAYFLEQYVALRIDWDKITAEWESYPDTIKVYVDEMDKQVLAAAHKDAGKQVADESYILRDIIKNLTAKMVEEIDKQGIVNQAINEDIRILTEYVGDLDHEKENWATVKSPGHSEWGTLDDMFTYFYNLRKSPTRKEQIESETGKNQNIGEILGLPDSVVNTDKLFWYFSRPYSEAGGFCLDIELVGRDKAMFYHRRISSTNNGIKKDTGWIAERNGGDTPGKNEPLIFSGAVAATYDGTNPVNAYIPTVQDVIDAMPKWTGGAF